MIQRLYLALVLSFFLTIVSFPIIAQETIYLQAGNLKENLGEINYINISLTNLTNGLSGYNITVTIENTTVAEIVDVEFPSWAILHSNATLPSDSIWIKAVDLNNNVKGSLENVLLARIAIRGDKAGNTSLALQANRVDDDNGNPILPTIKDGFLQVTIPDTTPPQISFSPSWRNWDSSNVSVTITISDTGLGLKKYRYAWSRSTSKPSSGWSSWIGISGSSYRTTKTRSNEGEWYLHVEAHDAANNYAYDCKGPYEIDKTNPTSSVNQIIPYEINSSSIIVTVTASDSLSGIKKVELWYRYSNDNNTWGSWVYFGEDSKPPYQWQFDFRNGYGYYEFYSIAYDKAGNYETKLNAETKCSHILTSLLRGYIKDKLYSFPIANVRIDLWREIGRASDGSIEYTFWNFSYTNEKGYFEFTNIPVGNYSAEFSAFGYVSCKVRISINESLTWLNVSMFRKIYSILSVLSSSNMLELGKADVVNITLTNLTNGLSGYNITVTIENTSIAEIVNVEFPTWATLHDNASLPADSVWIKAVDLQDKIKGTVDKALLGRITIRGDAVGKTRILVDINQLDDDYGSMISPISEYGSINVILGKYTIITNVSPDNAGYITLNPSGGIYDAGSVVTATAHAYSGYAFDHWGGDVSGTNPTITITMDSNKSITAYFVEINHPPVAHNDSYSTNENTALVVDAPGILANDEDIDGDDLTAELISNPQHGSLTLHSDGSFVYTPNPNYYGTDSFIYKAYDGSAYSNEAIVTITIIPPEYTTVYIENISAMPTQEVTVPIIINTTEAMGIGSATIKLYYNPSIVIVTDIADGELGSVTYNINNTNGVATMVAATAVSPGPTGKVYFANITLKAVGNAGDSCPLHLEVVSLYDATPGNPQPIDYITHDGLFGIEEGTPVIPSPDIVTLSHYQEGFHHMIDVSIQIGSPCYSIDWGNVTRVGNIFYANAKMWEWSGVCIQIMPSPLIHTYDLGILQPGNYTFIFRVWNETVGEVGFYSTMNLTLVNITPCYQQVNKNDIFVVNITIDPAAGIAVAGAQCDLLFNASLLEAIKVEEGNLFNGYTTFFNNGSIDNENGTIHGIYGVILSPGVGVSNKGIFVKITFRVRENAISTKTYINLTEVIVGDVNANHVPIKICNGTVEIVSNPYDINGDNEVNILDMIIIAQHWLETPDSSNWNPRADVNGDGRINVLDLIIVGQHFT